MQHNRALAQGPTSTISRSGERPASVFRPAGLAHLLLAAATLLWACGDDGGGGAADASGGGGPDASTDRATEYVANAAGLIHLTEGRASWLNGTQNLHARLGDAPAVPTASLLASSGECEIWVHPLPAFCDPPCNLGACVGEDECQLFPELVSAGDVTLTGLLEPLTFGSGEFGYAPDVFFEGEDLFADGAAITASAPGGDVPGFTLEATGVPSLVADLDLESGGILTIEDGVDEVIRWTAEGSGRVQLALVTGHHGSSYESLLVCESEDDGELIVPGDLIGLFPRQVSDLESHTSWLARYSRDVVDTDDGPIELFVSSTVIIYAVNHE
jgi:hypothetical protein